MSIIIFFAIVCAFLLFTLNKILGVEIGFKVEKENLRDFTEEAVEPKISDLEQKLKIISDCYKKFEAEDFLRKAEKVFSIVFSAYAQGDKSTLKDLLAPRTYNAFSMAIDDRKSRGEVLEGNLVRFVSMEILDAEKTDEDLLVTVKFVTEQSNVLKSSSGEVIEGDLDFVENRTDVWVFSRKIAATDSRWLLQEIKSEE